MAEAASWFVYVLRCRGDRLYCGITKDVEGRFADHVAGKGAKFTRAFPPFAVVAVKRAGSQREALRQERAFKSLTRQRKLARLEAWRGTEPALQTWEGRANSG